MELSKKLSDSWNVFLRKVRKHDEPYMVKGLGVILLLVFLWAGLGCCCKQNVTTTQGNCAEEVEDSTMNLLKIISRKEYVYGDMTLTIDSTFSIQNVMSFPFEDSLTMVNGSKDELGPTFSFIVNLNVRKVILLPSNRGCIGFTSEEGLPICLSYRHHANGEPGRFSVVSVYDLNGKLVKEMSLDGYGDN